MRILSHRGIGFGQPENSPQAAAAAAERGYGLELDVRLDAAGRPVISHDPPRAPFWPLTDALAFLQKQSVPVAFHLKSQDRAVWDPLADAVRRRPDWFIFDPDRTTARAIKQVYPNVPLALSVSERAFSSTLFSIDEALKCADADLIWWDEWTQLGAVYNEDQRARLRAAGKAVYAISPELHASTTPRHALADQPETAWRALCRLQVDGICTDEPERLASLVEREFSAR